MYFFWIILEQHKYYLKRTSGCNTYFEWKLEKNYCGGKT